MLPGEKAGLWVTKILCRDREMREQFSLWLGKQYYSSNRRGSPLPLTQTPPSMAIYTCTPHRLHDCELTDDKEFVSSPSLLWLEDEVEYCPNYNYFGKLVPNTAVSLLARNISSYLATMMPPKTLHKP